MEIRGGFSTKELSTTEKKVFAEYLQHSMNTPALEFIRYLLGDDYLKFIDIMSGTTLKIPSTKVLERDLESVRIYIYVRRGGFSEEAIQGAARSFNKTALNIKRFTLKVSKVLGVEDILEGDELNNYITNIKSTENFESYRISKAEVKRDALRDKRKQAEREARQAEEKENDFNE